METFSTIPIDVIRENGEWVSTYRYEPFLDKWFFIRPTMKAGVELYATNQIPQEVIKEAEMNKFEYKKTMSYASPIKLQIQLNRSCNYRCKMCYASSGLLTDESMDLQTLCRVMDDAKNAGILRINYVGGEPFIRQDFDTIVTKTVEKRLLVSCITNGIIPGSNIEKWRPVLRNMFSVQVSCNGIGESYNYEYNTDIWPLAKRCITNVIQNTEANILSFVITERNYEDIPAFLEFANEIKPSVVKFGSICWSGKAKGKETTQYYSLVLPKAKKLIEQGKKKFSTLNIQSQIDSGKNTELWKDYITGYRPFEFYFSPEGHDDLYLKSDGTYYPFPLLSEVSSFKAGDICMRINDVWRHSRVMNELRKVTFKNSDCGKLNCNNICGLWNRSYAFSWSGNLYGKVPCELSDWE